MDILEDLRTTTFSNNEAFFKKAACEIEQLRTENAALKEQVAHWKTRAEAAYRLHEYHNSIIGDWIDYGKRVEETIAQQAEVIEQMREALDYLGNNLGEYALAMQTQQQADVLSNYAEAAFQALALQPSPEILQARDKRVAEACAKVCIEQAEGIARSTPVSRDRVHTMFKGIARPAPVRDCSESSVRESAFRIRNGAWERHL